MRHLPLLRSARGCISVSVRAVYIQVWGYETGQTPGVDSMILLDEFRTTPVADTVMYVLMGPLRTYN